MEDNVKLFTEYKNKPTQELKDKIIINNAQLVKTIASKMYLRLGGTVEKEDLEGYGILGLIKTIDSFDLSLGVKFETYASRRIEGSILDEIRRMDWVPRSIRTFDKQINTVIDEYHDKYDKEPTPEEIAKELDVEVAKIYDHMSLMVHSNVSSLEGLKQNKVNDGDNLNAYDLIMDRKTATPEIEYLKTQDLPKILGEALELLTEKEKQVILMIYYEEMTLKETAVILEVSESRVSQLHTRALTKMRDGIKDGKELMSLFVA